MTTVALVAPGEMGSALGKVLTANGAEVWTLLDGRSAETHARAEAAGMVGVSPETLVSADFILSVLPPGQATAFAETIAPVLAAAPKTGLFVECNPLNPKKKIAIEQIITGAGARFVDGGIIGPIPRADYPGPMIYVAGPEARAVEALKKHGLRIHALDAPVGTAAALKLSYAAISKGLFAVASSAILGASRAGVGAELHREFSASQPGLMAFIARGIPDMANKTGRWVDEMREISTYLGSDRIEGALYREISDLYAHLTADYEGDRTDTDQLAAFFANGAGKDR